MKSLRFLACIFLYSHWASAQDIYTETRNWQERYKQEFLTDANSPLKAADTGFLRFYAPDEKFRVNAVFMPTPKSKSFQITTHSGKTKPYRCYGKITFRIEGRDYSLEVYQGIDLIKNPAFRDHLFIPFNDLTNNETTYGGGRYIDLKTGDIADGKVVLDFNRAYNPYCAFGEGYSCPIPPDANKLDVRIEAGEQNYAKSMD